MQDQEIRGDDDPRRLLRSLQDPALYTRFLSMDDEVGPQAVAPSTDGGDHRARHPVLRAPATTSPRPGHEPDPQQAADYLAHSADLTLSGGLGTALAAPSAVCALADHYVLRRVGGSSAAAVAAAAAAAAELGRTVDRPAVESSSAGGGGDAVPPGFAGLAAMAAWLAEGGTAGGRRLVGLLQPDARSRDLYRLAVALVLPPPRRAAPRWVRVTAAATATLDRAGWVVIGLLCLGAVAGWIGTITAIARSPHLWGALVPIAAFSLAVTFALAAVGGCAVIVLHAVRLAVRAAAAVDGFGLCPGGDSDESVGFGAGGRLDRLAGVVPAGGSPGLFTWVADRLDDLAGVPPAHAGTQRYALTFGELWLGRMGGRAATDLRALRRAAADPGERVIDLTLVATDLGAGRPRLLPFGCRERPEQVVEDSFLFCRSCLVGLLPARVVDQMVLMSPGSSSPEPCPRHPDAPLHDLPEPWDLPVAFAVRLAASTPGVLSAVPLYRVDRVDRASDGSGPARACWFVDGGLAGGLPVHAFDTALPRWPTFSLGADPHAPDDVTLPEQDAAEHPAPWRPVTGGAGLATAVLGAVLGWRDALQLEAPGLRGRAARIRGAERLTPLTDGEVILALAARGHEAGRMLRERFTGSDGADDGHTQTDRYRWVRLLAALTECRQLSLMIGARLPLFTDLALGYRVPAEVCDWFSPPLAPGHADPAWGDAVAAVTHLRSLADGGVLDWDTDWGAPPSDPHLRLR